MTAQEEETRVYFDSHAESWGMRAKGHSLLRERNAFVLSLAGRFSSVGRFLDLGCGTGELVGELSSRGWNSVGVDFSVEMIRLARETYPKEKFHCQNVFDFEPEGLFDLIAANGLIEYLPETRLNEFLRRCARMLHPRGILVLNSRNRLFNAFSLNEYTSSEIGLGTLALLMEEALELADAAGESELVARIGAGRGPLPFPERTPDTGIGVGLRYQFTPRELAYRLREAGLEIVSLFPLHFHALPPRLGGNGEEKRNARSFEGKLGAVLPFCSSYSLAASRRDLP